MLSLVINEEKKMGMAENHYRKQPRHPLRPGMAWCEPCDAVFRNNGDWYRGYVIPGCSPTAPEVFSASRRIPPGVCPCCENEPTLLG
jgi:hypothetical protein